MPADLILIGPLGPALDATSAQLGADRRAAGFVVLRQAAADHRLVSPASLRIPTEYGKRSSAASNGTRHRAVMDSGSPITRWEGSAG